jgi:hypothetical protein
MKKLLTVTAISVAVMLVVLPMTYGQDKAAPPAQTAERVFEGQLVKVDVDAKSITVKGAAEMMFDYTDATQIAGADGKIQGLASRTGAPLKVTYREAQGKRTATKIEVLEKK